MKYKDIPILMYHNISADINAEGSNTAADSPWCVPVSDFEEQMHFLHQEGYRTLSLSELKKGIESGSEFSGKAAVITFDDARSGVYAQAYSILSRFGFTATIFVVPAWIEGKHIPAEEGYSSFMTWGQLKELAGNEFEIGSHSYSHRNMALLSKEELIRELQEAQRLLTENLDPVESLSPTGGLIKHFSYPYGKHTAVVRDQVSSCHETAVTISRGFSKQGYAYARQGVMRGLHLDDFKKLLVPLTLSLCMIVKNEEQFLSDCLESIRSVVDEIIIVDTGSRDRTKEIAKRFTSHIYDYAWKDDFSAARNESLKYATGDWVLILDADEILSPEDAERIREVIYRNSITGYRIITKNYSNHSSISGWQPVVHNDHFSRGFQGWFPSLKVRLFRRGENFKFKGMVHEIVDEALPGSGGRGSISFLPSISIHHYGASRGDSSQKREFYMHMTREKIKDDPANAKAYFELGIQCKELGEYAQAEKAFLQAIHIQAMQAGSTSLMPLLNLGIVQQKKGDIDVAIRTYQQVLEKNPQAAEAHFGLGFCYFKKGDLASSRTYFEQAIVYNPAFLDAYVNLGAVHEREGNYAQALEVLGKAIQLSPTHARAYYNIGIVQEKAGSLARAAACYRKAIELGYSQSEEAGRRMESIQSFLDKAKVEAK